MGLKLFDFAYNTLLTKTSDQNSDLFLPKVLSGIKENGQPYLPLKVDQWKVDSLTGSGIDLLSKNFAVSWYAPYLNELQELTGANPPSWATPQDIKDAKETLDIIQKKGLVVIPCPDAPAPSLEVDNLEIHGLANIKVQTDTPPVTISNTGYTFTVYLDTNAYPSSGEEWNAPTSLSGTENAVDDTTKKPFLGMSFTMGQCLCFSGPASNACVPKPGKIHMPPSPTDPNGFLSSFSGICAIAVDNARLAADVNLGLTSDNQNMSLTINSLRLEAASAGGADASGGTPSFTMSDLAITTTPETEIFASVWATYYKNLIKQPETAEALTGKINSALADPHNIATIQQKMNDQLSHILQNLLGSPSSGFHFSPDSGSENNEVDQLLFARIADALNNQGSESGGAHHCSKYYVPWLILNSQSPVLEPYTTAPLSTDQTFHHSFFGTTATISQVKLPSGLTIKGVSNLIAPAKSTVFSQNSVTTVLEAARLSPGPTLTDGSGQKTVVSPPLKGESTFSIMIQIDTNPPVGPITGKVTIQVETAGDPTSPSVTTVSSASGTTVDDLTVTFTSIVLDAKPDEIQISIELSGDGAPYNNLMDALANQPVFKSAIVKALNSGVTQDLGTISNAATRFVKNQLNNLG